MTRFLVFVLLTAMTALGEEVPSTSVPSDQASSVTFNKDVLPTLQKNCQACHRPGGAAPMSFVTYESTRPWAKAIKTAVISKKMPPWFADPHYGEFRNAPKLTQADIDTLAAWADNGAPEGAPGDKPAALQFADGWKIQPDVVASMAKPYRVSAKGAGEIKEFFIPSPFKEDTWVTSIEIRPSDPSVVHHVIVQVPEQTPRPGLVLAAGPEDKAVAFAPGPENRVIGTAATVDALQKQVPLARDLAFVADIRKDALFHQSGGYSSVIARLRERQTGLGEFMTMEAVYAPGSTPLDFRFTDSAKLIRGGKQIRIEVHYTPNGWETTDQTMIGFTLAKTPAQRRFVIMAPEHLVDTRIPIPAGAANWETGGQLTFNQDADLVWFMPHMHLRGKDMSYRLIYPDGREETVLSAKFDFHWQLGYEVEKPIKVTKGTRMIVTAHHDNSANKRSNPTPDKAVAWGEMTSEEMMLPWFGVVVDRDVTPDKIASYRPGDLDGPLPGINR